MLLPQADRQKAVETQRAPKETAVAHQLTIGTALCRGAETGASQVSSVDAALHQPREPWVPAYSQSPRGQHTRHQSPEAWRK